jgi:pyrroline-5-carboxylate reductase
VKKILFYGGGNIAQSVIEGLIKSGFPKKNIYFIDRNPSNQKKLKKLKIRKFVGDANEIDFFILCVKPKDALNAYEEITNMKNNLKIVSFVAGIKSKRYLKLNKNVKFLRAMPNTSSRFDLGITALFNYSFQKTDMAYIKGLFKKFGKVIELDHESKMDQFTGLVGSGPAYFFYLLKTYEKELLKMCNGNKDEVASIMNNLLEGVSKSIKVNDNLDELIKMVASKKGTTEAGLKSFSSNNINKIFKDGLKKAIERSKEISNEY